MYSQYYGRGVKVDIDKNFKSQRGTKLIYLCSHFLLTTVYPAVYRVNFNWPPGCCTLRYWSNQVGSIAACIG